MNVTETLLKIKALFNDMPATPEVPVAPSAPAKMVDATLQDGTAITVDKMEVGGKVLIGGVPAPDAEYVLSDGTNITTVGGIITEIESGPAEASEPQAEMQKYMRAVEKLQSDFTAHKQSFAVAQETISKQDEVIKGLLSVVEQLAKIPTAAPAAPAQSFRSDKSASRAERMEAITKAVKELRK